MAAAVTGLAVDVIGDEQVDVGVKHAVESFGTLFRQPPAVLDHDQILHVAFAEAGLELGLAELVLDPDPVAVLDAVLLAGIT